MLVTQPRFAWDPACFSGHSRMDQLSLNPTTALLCTLESGQPIAPLDRVSQDLS
jgi:hypothetical protein